MTRMNYYLFVRIFVLFCLLLNFLQAETPKCSADESHCGSICYSKDTHKCIFGILCGKEQGRCMDKCYDLKTHKCIWGRLCLKHEAWCDNKCIDPTVQRCRRRRLINL